ncbi:MAG: 16S rRNA (uracil(1498)-N(3))-methyltransferase [Aquificae bacterium]|nr:16S rRNA (uracil(1498)-N(3))-methyltransferase [Aquificota bacterium]
MGLARFIGQVKNGRFSLEGEEYHHAKVRRIKEGQLIEVNNLQGEVFLCRVEEVGKKQIRGEVVGKVNPPEEKIRIELFLGMPNRLSKVDELIEPITELGVERLIPVITKNSAVKPQQVIKKLPKWEKISLNSIKQCGRLFPVKIEKPIKIGEIKTQAEKKVLFYEKERERSLTAGESCKTAAVVVGGEGGFTEEEVRLLEEKGFLPYSLGEYILRMETAVITSICQVKFSCR